MTDYVVDASIVVQVLIQDTYTVHDSVYIALAEKLNYPLITADNRQEQAARSTGVIIKPITDF